MAKEKNVYAEDLLNDPDFDDEDFADLMLTQNYQASEWQVQNWVLERDEVNYNIRINK